jgi:sulfur relay (sulfurtransferase) DsrC/TusE family protein
MLMMAMMMNQQNQAAVEARNAREFQQNLFNQAKARADAEIAAADKRIAERKATGEAGRSGYIANVQNRLSMGLIGEETAQKLVEDYYTKYDIAPSATELAGITETYKKVAPKQREAAIQSLYQRNLGRAATAEELAQGQSQMSLGRTQGDLEQDLQASAEYKKSRPRSAFEAEMEARYGGPILDESGTRTGKYKYNFGGGTLPQLSADVIAKSGIQAPGFLGKDFIGSAEEIEGAKQSKNNYETFAYNSGLKALDGDIAREQIKLQTESQLKIGRQQEQYGLLRGLVGAFSFA